MSEARRSESIVDLARESRANPLNAAAGFYLAIVIVIAGFCDVISTDLALSTGTAREANPVIRMVQDLLGPLWVAPKMALHGVLGYMVMWFPDRATLVAMSLVTGVVFLASINNLSIYLEAIGVL